MRGAWALALAAACVGCGAGDDEGKTGVEPSAVAAAREEATVQREPQANDDDALRKELEGIWNGVRTAFAEYRLDDAIQYLDVPADAPRPSREDAKAVAEFLPDATAGRFIALEREGDVVALYRDTGEGPDETEVTVLRFRRAGAGWKIYPSPHSSNSVSVPRAEAADAATLRKSREELAVVPAGD